MKKKVPNVLVYVSGGNVQSANADSPVGIEIFDVDNLEAEGKSKDEIEVLWKERSKGMIAIY